MKGVVQNMKGLWAKGGAKGREGREGSGGGMPKPFRKSESSRNMSESNDDLRVSKQGSRSSGKAGNGNGSSSQILAQSGDASSSFPPKHTFTVSGAQFVVDTRYIYIKPLGTGAYGVVCSANDVQTNKKVAIKKIVDAFDDITDLKRILREIRLMRALHHENLLGLEDLDRPLDYSHFTDIYMITELMDTDLAKLLSRMEKLLADQCKYFVYQMVRAMKYLHTANVLHRDLKPANILVNANCDLKICDFGLARYLDPDQTGEKTDYVVTRWYRAPELMLSHHYTNAIDMWSIGCIMAEMLTGKVLFRGNDVKHQLELICEVTGKPTKEDIWYVQSKRALKFLDDLPDTPKRPFSEIFKKVTDADALDLMEKLLAFDPAKRVGAQEALGHKYLEDYHDPEDEPEAPPNLLDDTIEPESAKKLNKEELRVMLWQEVIKFHPDDEHAEVK